MEQGAQVRGEGVVIVRGGKEEFVMRVSEVPLPGAHNLENVLAATTAARLAKVDAESIGKAVKSFAGVEHRLSSSRK